MAWKKNETCVACGKMHTLCWAESEAPSGLWLLAYVCPNTTLLVLFDGNSQLAPTGSYERHFVELRKMEKIPRNEFKDRYFRG